MSTRTFLVWSHQFYAALYAGVITISLILIAYSMFIKDSAFPPWVATTSFLIIVPVIGTIKESHRHALYLYDQQHKGNEA